VNTKAPTHPVIDRLVTELERRRAKDGRLSLRAFALELRLDPSTLSQLVRGRRRLTLRAAQAILERLAVPQDEAQLMLKSFIGSPPEPPRPRYVDASPEQAGVMAAWTFFAVLRALEIPGAPHTPDGIAAKIGCSPHVAKTTLQTALELGYVRFEDGRYLPTNDTITVRHRDDNSTRAALIRAHCEAIERALAHLLQDKYLGQSDISGITVAISSKKVAEAKRRILEFRRSLAAFLADGEKDEVYRLNIQLFPMKP
jgi:transcriptional regulator with XRE-family HTH domain